MICIIFIVFIYLMYGYHYLIYIKTLIIKNECKYKIQKVIITKEKENLFILTTKFTDRSIHFLPCLKKLSHYLWKHIHK